MEEEKIVTPEPTPSSAPAEPPAEFKAPEPKEKSNSDRNGFKIATIILAVVAFLGIGFGVFGIFFSASKAAITNCIVEFEDEFGPGEISWEENDEEDAPGTTLRIEEMGIMIKNLDRAGEATSYTYNSRPGVSPNSPKSTLEILVADGTPEGVATDFVTGISGAIIYEYSTSSLFDPETSCDAPLMIFHSYSIAKEDGTLDEDELNYCVKRRPMDATTAPVSADMPAYTAWNAWAESNVEKLMTVLSDSENYEAFFPEDDF